MEVQVSGSQFKTIVVGVDFSRYSKAAVTQARAFAKKWSLPLVFVHGFDDPVIDETRFHSLVVHIKKELEKKARTYYKISPKEKIIVKCGRPFEEVLRTAEKFSKPLIVVGHRGQRGFFSKAFIGSTAERVAQRSKVPVWIHRGPNPVNVRRVLVPCDLSDRASQTTAFVKKSFATKAVELFHVAQLPVPLMDFDTWNRMKLEAEKENSVKKRRFQKKYPSLKITEAWGVVFDEIEKRARKSDLIAISPRKNKGFFAGFGSVTSKVVRTSKKCVLVIP